MMQLWTCAACGKKFATEAEAKKCFEGHKGVKVIPLSTIAKIKNDIILAGVKAKEEGDDAGAIAYAFCLDVINDTVAQAKTMTVKGGTV